MDMKNTVINKLFQDPRFLKLIQNPKVMQAAMNAMQARNRLQQRFDERVEKLAKALNLATKSEVRELKRALTRLEQERKAQRANDGA
jgi:Fe-S cluster assembly ATPase SufC